MTIDPGQLIESLARPPASRWQPGRIVVAALATLVALLASCGSALAVSQNGIVRPVEEPPEPTLKLGEELFNANCATCHGIGGRGISKPRPGAGQVLGAGPPLTGVGALAADFYLRTGFMPLENIYSQPSRKRVLFRDKEVKALIKFVASLGPGPAIPHPNVANADLAEGFRIFTEDCAGCHQSVGRGGFVTGARVPPLQKVSPRQVAEAVRIGPYLMPRFPKSQISDGELSSIVRYVMWTNRPANRGGWSIGNLGPIPEGLIAWFAALVLAVGCLALSRRLKG